jgi:DNA-binding response OmpR family regulator
MKLLLIEDDVKLCQLVRRGLLEDGHVVDVEYDGVAGERTARADGYGAIVLDVMLPKKDGLAVVRALRAAGVATPVLILTARDTPEDVVAGLDAGADDYLRKPFDFAELEARLRSITRRDPGMPKRELRVADVVLDLATRRVTRAGRELEMTAREVAFLEYFMRNARLLITRPMLENALWDRESEATSNVIEVYVRRLRAKLSVDGLPPLLHTVRGAGYRFGTR